MSAKTIFMIVAAIVLARLLLQWLVTQALAMKRMTPAQILRWRLAHGEIDQHEYGMRLSRLQRMIEAATGKTTRKEASR